SGRPVPASQRRSVWSRPAEASVLPSGRNARASTLPWCPSAGGGGPLPAGAAPGRVGALAARGGGVPPAREGPAGRAACRPPGPAALLRRDRVPEDDPLLAASRQGLAVGGESGRVQKGALPGNRAVLAGGYVP